MLCSEERGYLERWEEGGEERRGRFTVVDATSPILSAVFSKAVEPYNMEIGVTTKVDVKTSRSWREERDGGVESKW